ncbi:amino acid ABC transporter permease [Nocardioides sp. SYSU DS0663]|uniref:amino acid ABC transporter permease n=1 Tax=Nocardioides sp. SYSU DS0663 TaxID=3416445 RepID=UPI003F4B4E52
MTSEYISEAFSRIVGAFGLTLQILVYSMVVATLVGLMLGAMRVSPIPTLRAVGTVYVNLFRNTPLVVLFIFAAVGLPDLGLLVDSSYLGQNTFFWRAVTALGLYTAAFVCEAVRSGVNTVDAGQAEAARAIGLDFTGSLRHVVMPQALRNVVPPLTSVYVALTKNTSVAAGFGVTEATYQLSDLIRDFPGSLWWSFIGIALGYVIIVAVLVMTSKTFERRTAAAR